MKRNDGFDTYVLDTYIKIDTTVHVRCIGKVEVIKDPIHSMKTVARENEYYDFWVPAFCVFKFEFKNKKNLEIY